MVDCRYICSYAACVDFEWDDAKKRSNRSKHGVDFELAQELFTPGAGLLTALDERASYGEASYIGFGMVRKRLLAVCFMHRENRVRIISLRGANEREKKGTKKRSAKARAVDPRITVDEDEIPDMSGNEAFWAHAKLFDASPSKTQVTMRIDADIINWFKGQGRGYQTKMNAALRAFMNYNRR